MWLLTVLSLLKERNLQEGETWSAADADKAKFQNASLNATWNIQTVMV